MASNTELLVELGVDSSKFSKQITAVTKEVKELDKELKALDTTTDNYNTNMQNMATYTEKCKTKISDLETILDAQNKALTEAKTKFENAKKAQEEYLNGTEKSAKETEKHQKAVEQAGAEVQKYTNGIKETERQIQSATQDLAKMNAEIAKAPYEEMSKRLNNVSDSFGKISDMTKPVTVAVSGIGAASIKTAMDFEQGMANIQAVTGATEQQMAKLETKAREIGSTTSLSASQGAEALLYLSQSGYSVEESIAAVDDVVNLAIASNMDLGEATKIVTANLASYKIGVDDANRVTDVLAQTASSSNTNVQELGQAFETIAPVAGAVGYTIEDTSLALGILANNAITGSTAGTALRSVLSKLVDPTAECQKAMEKYGISLVNSDGSAKSLKDVLLNLRTAFSTLDETQKAELASTLAGQEGMSALLAIVNAGDKDFENLSSSINNSNGKAKEMADVMASTSEGGLKSLLSKLEEASITIGNKLLPAFDKVVGAVSKALDWFNNLSEGTQNMIITCGLLAAGVSPVTGAISSLTGGLSSLASKLGDRAFKTAMVETTTTVAEIGTSALATTGSIAGSGGLIASFGSLATAVAPWLIGGALVVALGLGFKKMYDDMQETKQQALLLSDTYEGAEARIEESNRIMAENFNTKYQEVKSTMETFKTEAATALAEAFANAQEPTSINLDNYNSLISGKLQETLGIIQQNQTELSTGLALFNSNYADQTVLGWDTINNITQNKGSEMEKHVQVAYDNLLNVQKKSALIGQEITDEYGNKMVYTTEMYYDELQAANDYFYEEALKAQVGFYGDELWQQESFVNDSAATTYKQYTQQLDDAEAQRDELKAIADQHYNDQMDVITQLSDEELALMGFTREELIRIAQLQREQYYAEAEGMYQDAKAKYTEMAEDTTTITDEQRKTTIENARKAKEGTVAEIDKAQREIDKILGLVEDDVDDMSREFTIASSKSGTSVHNMKNSMDTDLDSVQDQMGLTGDSANDMSREVESGTRKTKTAGQILADAFVLALKTMGVNISSTSGKIGTESGKMSNNLGKVKKSAEEIPNNVDIRVTSTANTSALDTTKSKLKDIISLAGTAISKAGAAVMAAIGLKDAIVPTINFGSNYNSDDIYGMKDTSSVYGLKDGDVRTISLATFGQSDVSPVATKDSYASSVITGAVQNYNNSRSSVTNTTTNSNDILLNKKLDILIDLIAQQQTGGVTIEQVNIDAQNKSAEQIMKEIDFITRIKGKRY